jgi:chaperone BCS1
MTTNHPERLDPALVRPGRVDRSFHLGHTTPDQARRLFTWFYSGGRHDPAVEHWARAFACRIPEGRVCMAAIQEHLLRFRSDPESAVRALDIQPLGAPAEHRRLEPEPVLRAAPERSLCPLPCCS